MNFAGMEYLLYFFPLFFLIYWTVSKEYKNFVLLTGSAVFYLFGDTKTWWLLPILAVFHYAVGRRLIPARKKGKKKKELDEHKRRRGWMLFSAILIDALVLCYYKLFEDQLPLGLSFYLFQAIAYLVDVYRTEIPAEDSFWRFLLYLGMFPKIGSGPITPYEDVRRELRERSVTPGKIQSGLQRFTLGLAYKIFLADTLGVLWHDVQVAGYESITWKYAWLGAIAFSLKLYYDFYGYSLMAIGLGEMLGFQLPDNFTHPYLSRSVREFYRRWHVTLGAWFRKYIYIPLGGNRKGEGRTILNLLAVWVLTGFWHGVSINFILWGLFLWCCIILERWAEKLSFVKKWKVLPHLWLWFVIPISWMFFAITDPAELQTYLTRMFGIGDAANMNLQDWWIALKRYGFLLAAGAACCSGGVEYVLKKNQKKLWLNVLLAAVFWLCAWRILLSGSNPFMYLQF